MLVVCTIYSENVLTPECRIHAWKSCLLSKPENLFCNEPRGRWGGLKDGEGMRRANYLLSVGLVESFLGTK